MHETPDTNKKELYRRAADTPWLLSHAPFRVAPRVYYVGNSWVGAYLVDTSDGLILIDTTLFESVYQVLESIWELGFDARDIKHILLTHCHIDHSGGVNQIAGISGAKVWLSREDARFCNHEANLSLGKLFKLAPFEADCYYDDASPIVLGDVIVRTRLTPGHHAGSDDNVHICTGWAWRENDRRATWRRRRQHDE